MYQHTNTVIFFYSENSMPFFGGEKKTPSNEKLIELLLIKVQTMLCITFSVHIYSADMQKTLSTTSKHNKVSRIQVAHLLVC